MSGTRPATQIESLVSQIHENNKRKGFWDKELNIGEKLMLITSELAEALEADRKGKKADLQTFNEAWYGSNEYQHGSHFTKEERIAKFKDAFESNIKDSFEDELADTLIRIFDVCGGLGIDIDSHVKLKIQYNETRAHMHGKKY